MRADLDLAREIIAREFRQIKDIEPGTDIDVQFTEDETIVVSFQCKEYVMEIGSEDDYFWFKDLDSDDVVRFDFPADWPEEFR